MNWAKRKKNGTNTLRRTREVAKETREKISNALRGRKMPEEVRAKISAALKGRKISPQHRQALRERSVRKKNPPLTTHQTSTTNNYNHNRSISRGGGGGIYIRIYQKKQGAKYREKQLYNHAGRLYGTNGTRDAVVDEGWVIRC